MNLEMKAFEMNVCLLGPPTIGDKGGTFPPLTLTHLATILTQTNTERTFNLKVIDLQLEFTRENLNMLQPDLDQQLLAMIQPADLEVLLITTMCNNLPLALRTARICKGKNPDLKVVLGGTHVTLVADSILRAFPFVSIVVRGEGEKTLVMLLDHFSGKIPIEEILGISFRKDGEIFGQPDQPLLEDLDDLPITDFNLVPPLQTYEPDRRAGEFAAFVDVGRGCPHHCDFCSTTLMWNRRVRQKSVSRLISEMDTLYRKQGIRHFFFNQDEFTSNKRFMTEFCDALQKKRRTYRWKIFCRLDDLDSEILQHMVHAGCSGVFWGLESPSRARLEKLNKKVPLERAFPLLEYLCTQEVECIASLIIGFVDETWTELDATLNMGLQLALNGAQVNLQLLTPIPGTKIWNQYKHRIRLFPDYYPHYDNAEFLSPPEHRLIANHPEIFTVFYNYELDQLDFADVFGLYLCYRNSINQCPELIHRLANQNQCSLTELYLQFKGQHPLREDAFVDFLESQTC